VRILLDTHILIWMLENSSFLSQRIRDLFADLNVELNYSSVSVAEIAVKHKIHPEQMPLSGEEAAKAFSMLGCSALNFDLHHAAAMDNLPLLHRDPFDRMLLAQAKAEGMKVVSHDNRFPSYGDFVIEA